MSRHRPLPRVLWFTPILLLFLFAPGCHKAEPAGEEEEHHAAPVKWEPAEKADLEEWTELLGTTQPLPKRLAQISAAVAGRVTSVLPASEGSTIVEGQHIPAGQILVQLDDRVQRANRDKLVAGEAELKEQIKQAASAVELARLDIDRLERLQGSNGNGNGNGNGHSSSLPLVSRIELEKTRVALKDAESKHKAVQAKEEIARAELKAIDAELSLYTLRTPIAGQLGILHVRPGQTLAAGAAVAEVIDLDEIDVLCFVPARTVSHLKLGQMVRMEEAGHPAADATKVEEGSIVFISEQAQSETGTVAVKARFPNRNRKLRANTLVRVRVLTEKKAECLSIPEAALLEDQEEPAVLIVETEKTKNEKGEEVEEHKVHKLQAKLGLRDRNKHRVEILALIDKEKKKEEEVEKDTLFVVEGGHGLEDDDPVTLQKEEEHEEHKDEK